MVNWWNRMSCPCPRCVLLFLIPSSGPSLWCFFRPPGCRWGCSARGNVLMATMDELARLRARYGVWWRAPILPFWAVKSDIPDFVVVPGGFISGLPFGLGSRGSPELTELRFSGGFRAPSHINLLSTICLDSNSLKLATNSKYNDCTLKSFGFFPD